MKKGPIVIFAAFLCMVLISALGYILVGGLPAILFTLSFLVGLVLWFIVPVDVPFGVIRMPFYLTFTLYVLNKLEESILNFFPALSNIIEIPVSKSGSLALYFVQTIIWLFIPFLIKRRNQLGYYLLWTFYTSMGFIEMVHLLLPLLAGNPFSYFPGMASFFLLAPAAWWGMYQLL